MSKFSMEAFLEINYELVFKERKGTSFHNMSQKDQKFSRKLTFDILKFKVGAKPPKRCANIIADSETFKRYGDFDT